MNMQFTFISLPFHITYRLGRMLHINIKCLKRVKQITTGSGDDNHYGK